MLMIGSDIKRWDFTLTVNVLAQTRTRRGDERKEILTTELPFCFLGTLPVLLIWKQKHSLGIPSLL